MESKNRYDLRKKIKQKLKKKMESNIFCGGIDEFGLLGKWIPCEDHLI